MSTDRQPPTIAGPAVVQSVYPHRQIRITEITDYLEEFGKLAPEEQLRRCLENDQVATNTFVFLRLWEIIDMQCAFISGHADGRFDITAFLDPRWLSVGYVSEALFAAVHYGHMNCVQATTEALGPLLDHMWPELKKVATDSKQQAVVDFCDRQQQRQVDRASKMQSSVM